MADHGPLIVRIELDDPVSAAERPEELNLKLGVRCLVDDPGLALDVLDLAVEGFLPAAVDDLNLAVGFEGICGRDRHAAFLEALRYRRNLIPGAEVAFEVDVIDHLERLVLGRRRGKTEQAEGQAEEEYLHGSRLLIKDSESAPCADGPQR